MSDAQTSVLYTLSTLAQTCAALAALVGAVGLYRLQALRDQHTRNEEKLRQFLTSATLDPGKVARTSSEDIVESVRQRMERSSATDPAIENMRHALTKWDTFPNSFSRATRTLLVFEAWNLLVIDGALVGFNYVPALAVSPWTFWGIWVVAVVTVAVTAYCVFGWTKE